MNMTSRFTTLFVVLVVPILLVAVHAERHPSNPQRWASTFELRADTTCPVPRPEAEAVLKRFLTHTDFSERLAAYDHTGVDTSEVVVVADATICMALDSTIAQAYPDSTLSFILSTSDISYFETDSFYYAVELPRRPDPNPDYVFVAMGGISVIGKDYVFKRGFNF